MDRVTTIIVNYRLKYFLEQALLSLREAYRQIPGHTIVIDNASGDDSIDFLKARFPEVEFICNEKNVGFAKANNQGFALAETEYILVLNPDTIVSGETLRKSVEWMDSHADCAAAGVKMVDGNGNFLPESKRSFPSVWNSFCKLFGLSAIFPKSRLFARYHLRHLDENKPHVVPVLAGAFMLLRAAVVKKTGGFDEEFFMYGEDMDLSYRMAQDGMVNYYLPEPIIHYKGECTKTESLEYVRIFYEAMYIFFRKHYPKTPFASRLLIKSAIGMRRAASVLKRTVVSPVLAGLRRKTDNARTFIVSKNPDEVIKTLDGEGFVSQGCSVLSSIEELGSTSGRVDIILDDRDMDYGGIISAIIANRGRDRYFHIYSGRNGIVISPKSQR